MSDHYPVMLNEVLEAVDPQDGDVIVDGTFGAGGYTTAFLERANCTVIAIDQDPTALKTAEALKNKYGERFVFARGRFGDAVELVRQKGFKVIDGFVLDVGVSSMQIDQAERGFSFQKNGPLDMRMDTQDNPVTAQKLVMELPEEELANIIYQYGGERKSRHIAHRICLVRQEKEIKTTQELSEIVNSVIHRAPKDKINPATRTFQALRIAVNNELGELRKGLDSAEQLLDNNGRIVVVSFHSLEDSIVKNFFDEKSGRQVNQSRHLPSASLSSQDLPTFRVLKRKAVEATKEEVLLNPRSRSAKMRKAIRINQVEAA